MTPNVVFQTSQKYVTKNYFPWSFTSLLTTEMIEWPIYNKSENFYHKIASRATHIQTVLFAGVLQDEEDFWNKNGMKEKLWR